MKPPNAKQFPQASVVVGQIFVLALVYSVAGALGLTLAEYHHNATLVCPATGVALAILILFGVRLWPGIFIGVLLLKVAMNVDWFSTLGIATGNTLEALPARGCSPASPTSGPRSRGREMSRPSSSSVPSGARW